MLWVRAVSSAPLVSGDAPRRRASTASSRARSRWLSSSRSDSATSRATCACSSARLLGQRRRIGRPLALTVGTALVDDRQRAGRERAGEEDRDGGEGAAEPAPGAGLACEPIADRPVLAVGDSLAGGDELVDVRCNVGVAGDELDGRRRGGHRGRRRRRNAPGRPTHGRRYAARGRGRDRRAPPRATSPAAARRGTRPRGRRRPPARRAGRGGHRRGRRRRAPARPARRRRADAGAPSGPRR